jgi:dual specificity protein phosphatase 1B
MDISNYISKVKSYIPEVKIPRSVEDNVLWGYGYASRWIQPAMNRIKGNEFDINEVITGVYISDFASACNVEELKKNGITHIVTAISGVGKMYKEDFEYYEVDETDRPHSEIEKYFDECADFIDNAVNDGKKVLIHCKCGVSRSSTLTAAYLIKKKNYSTDGAIDTIKKSRDCIRPNTGFEDKLRNYEKKIKKQSENEENKENDE